MAFTLVPSLQVDADLTADAGVQTLIDVCAQREKEKGRRRCEGRETQEDSWYTTCLINQVC